MTTAADLERGAIASEPGLADELRASGSMQITRLGRVLHSLVELEVPDQTVIEVFRIRANPARTQLLNLRVPGGGATVNGRHAAAVRFDLARSPDRIVARVDAPSPATVHVWNSWLADDRIHSWTGNAAMEVDETDGGLFIRASDGVGAPSFDDLVALLRITEPA